jgi:hypothetical protein
MNTETNTNFCGYAFEGSRFQATKNMSRADIAKLFRQDIKEAIKCGFLPNGLKVSVRTSEFSGGGSINVRVTAVPEGLPLLFIPRAYSDFCNPHTYCEMPILSTQAAALVQKLDSMLQQYNFDNSDIETDYFHMRFCSSIDIDRDLISKERSALNLQFHAHQYNDSVEFNVLAYREEVERLSADPSRS